MQDFLASARLDNRRFNRIVLSLLGAGFLAVFIAGFAVVVLLARNEEQSSWVRHTYEVERHVSAIQLTLSQMRYERRLRTREGHSQDRLRAEIEEVRRLTVDNPVQQRNVDALLQAKRHLETVAQQTAFAPDIREQAIQRAGDAVERKALDMLAVERGLLADRANEQKANAHTLYWVVGFAALMVGLVGAGSILIIRGYTTSLTEARDQLQALNDGLEDAVAVRTVDLQRANDEIQRFAYIVSHDLRSPLVNVMGFTAEVEASIAPLKALLARLEEEAPHLLTMDARQAIAEDVPESVGFIRSSTQKMDRLINAILRLSREGRRTITPERLDLADLATGVVDTLRHRIDALGVTVDVSGDMPSIVSDRLAVEQILGNLVENAVKYLQPGRPGLIQINGQIRLGRAMVHVRDNGRGIEKRDHDRVFDLFRRSGEQDQPGEGIGLAHVRALAYRLGGTITLESELGVGSTFTLNLPVEFIGDKGAQK